MGYLDVHHACNIVLLTPGNEGNPVLLDSSNYISLLGGGTALLDGSMGQVMKQIPMFHYSYSFGTGPDYAHNWQISLRPFPGSQPHPWFFKSGQWVDHRYEAVYPSAWYDASAYNYVDGDGVNSGFDLTADRIGSIVGKKPVSNLTRAQFRSAAARVGIGWSITDFWGYSARKLLFVTKYGHLNSQLLFGNGNTCFSGFSFASCIGTTGKVRSLFDPGHATGGGEIGDYSNYDGIEDAFGGLFEFIDGWNIPAGGAKSYVCSNPANFADDTDVNYGSYGSAFPATGWQRTLQHNIGLLPAGTEGSGTSTSINDYYSQFSASNWTVPRVGGAASSALTAGLLNLDLSLGSASANSQTGARLCF